MSPSLPPLPPQGTSGTLALPNGDGGSPTQSPFSGSAGIQLPPVVSATQTLESQLQQYATQFPEMAAVTAQAISLFRMQLPNAVAGAQPPAPDSQSQAGNGLPPPPQQGMQ